MGFKCSIFGHDYGETEVERERQEDGNEVVVTIRETETCERCGEEHLVSENKEVTTMETAADIVAEDLEAESEAESQPSPDTVSEPEPEPQPAASPAGEPDQPSDSPDEVAETTIPDAETEKAVKMGGDHDETEEMAPAQGEDDAVILDDDDEDEPESDRKPGEWPDEPDDDDEWEQPTDVDSPIDQDGPQITSTGSAVTVPDGEFYCPECDYTTTVESSSLREGDYCPECHRGSLHHRSE